MLLPVRKVGVSAKFGIDLSQVQFFRQIHGFAINFLAAANPNVLGQSLGFDDCLVQAVRLLCMSEPFGRISRQDNDHPVGGVIEEIFVAPPAHDHRSLESGVQKVIPILSDLPRKPSLPSHYAIAGASCDHPDHEREESKF